MHDNAALTQPSLPARTQIDSVADWHVARTDPRDRMALDPMGETGLDGPDAGAFDPMALTMRVLRYRWLIALLVLASLALTVVMTWSQTPLYRAHAKLEIVTEGPRIVEDLQIVTEASGQRALQTAIAKVRSRTIAERVAFDLGLANNERFIMGERGTSAANLLHRMMGVQPKAPDVSSLDAESRRRIAVGRIMNGLSVAPLGNTSILTIAFADPDPEIAARVANQVARSFMVERVDQSSATSELAREFIAQQVTQVKSQLQSSEHELVKYAKEAGITMTGEETSLIASNLQALNTSLAQAVEKRLELKRQVAQIDAGGVEVLPQVIDSTGLARMREKLVKLRAEYREKGQTLKPAFPEMKSLAAQIASIEKGIDQSISAIGSSVRAALDEAVQREVDLETELRRLEDEQAAYQDKRVRYTILKREVDSNRAQYDSLIGKLNTIGVGAELRDARAQLVESAVVPGGPFAPVLTKNLMFGLLASLLGAAGVIYVLELLNNRFSDPEQVERELKLPVLGTLPKLDDSQIAVALADPTSALSESYRALGVTLEFTGTEGFPRTLCVTSTEQSETKSTTALQLARNLAALGNKVLLVDCDMRRPNLHRVANLSNAVGLSNLLTSTVDQEFARDAFKRLDGDKLMVVTAGPTPPSPAELLASPKMSVLLGSLRKAYDIVMVDSPPVLGIADALVLSRMCEATLMMVSTNQVRRKSATIALRKLRTAGAQVVGAAMSKFTVGRFDYSYEYRYMSYDYGIETEQQQRLPDPQVETLESELAALVQADLSDDVPNDADAATDGAETARERVRQDA